MQWHAYFRGVRSLKFYPVLGLACLCPEGLSETNVSEIPELPYYSGMQAIVGVMATDALVVSFKENGPFGPAAGGRSGRAHVRCTPAALSSP
jgi:hypothetical protein